jgi:hypothetical protein
MLRPVFRQIRPVKNRHGVCTVFVSQRLQPVQFDLEGDEKMKNAWAILGGLGAGAALMYLMDPQRGNQRRALIRDKASSWSKKTREAIDTKARDLRNRAQGMLHEGEAMFTSGKEETGKHEQTSF